MLAGIVLIVADSALFMINIGNTWSTSVSSEIFNILEILNILCYRDLRAPMVQQMRDIAPSTPDVVRFFIEIFVDDLVFLRLRISLLIILSFGTGFLPR